MIRKPKRNDLSRTAEIHICGWRYAYSGMIPNEELYNNRNVENAIKSHQNILDSEPEIFDIYDDGIIKGIILHNSCRDENSEDAYELFAIYVEPSFTRQGVGSKLLEFVENRCLDQNKKRVVLWVLEENKKAIQFYNKNGYFFDGTTKTIDAWNQKEIRLTKSL